MTQVNSVNCVGGATLRRSVRQPCLSPRRDGCRRMCSWQWRCGCHWRGVVWVVLVTLLGCVVVTNTSSVPRAAFRGSEAGLSAARLSRSSLLHRAPSFSSDINVDVYDDDSDADSPKSRRRRWNAALAKTSDQLSTSTARRRLDRRRRQRDRFHQGAVWLSNSTSSCNFSSIVSAVNNHRPLSVQDASHRCVPSYSFVVPDQPSDNFDSSKWTDAYVFPLSRAFADDDVIVDAVVHLRLSVNVTLSRLRSAYVKVRYRVGNATESALQWRFGRRWNPLPVALCLHLRVLDAVGGGLAESQLTVYVQVSAHVGRQQRPVAVSILHRTPAWFGPFLTITKRTCNDDIEVWKAAGSPLLP